MPHPAHLGLWVYVGYALVDALMPNDDDHRYTRLITLSRITSIQFFRGSCTGLEDMYIASVGQVALLATVCVESLEAEDASR